MQYNILRLAISCMNTEPQDNEADPNESGRQETVGENEIDDVYYARAEILIRIEARSRDLRSRKRKK